MALSNFIGPDGYGFKADERPRGPRIPSPSEDQARARVVRRDLLPRPPACVLEIGDDGKPEPASLARAERLGCPLPKAPLKLKLPESVRSQAPPPPEVRAGAERPEILEDLAIALNVQTTGAGGATAATALFNYPVLLESVTYIRDGSSVPGDTDSAWIDYDSAAVPLFNVGVDDPIFTYAFGLTAGDMRFPAATGPFGPVVIPCHKLITKVPWRFAASINSTPIGTVTALWNFKIRVASAQQIQRNLPFTQVIIAPPPQVIFRASPPQVVVIRDRVIQQTAPPAQQRTYGAQAASDYLKLDSLAQKLRESPFGVPHTQMVATAQQMGFANGELAVTRAIQLATRPPLPQTLVAGL